LKERELTPYLTSKKEKLDFVNPEHEVEIIDSYDIRQKILNISYVDWKKLGFSKGTLHYIYPKNQNEKKGIFFRSIFENSGFENILENNVTFQINNMYYFFI
jgi:hypothetical protein